MAMSINPVVTLNVGGVRFSTSKETLTWVNDSFFTGLLSGRISSHQDDQGAIFIDRDPDLFRVILNFLRTREVDLHNVDIKSLKREAEFFGIGPLAARLTVCDELEQSSCGTVLFHGMLQRPALPIVSETSNQENPFHAKHSTSQTSVGSDADVMADLNKVLVITGHNSWIAVAYAHCVICYKVKESCGWQQVFISPYLSECVERAAINAKVQGMAPDSKTRMVAVAFSSSIRLWSFQDEQNYSEIGTFDMACCIDTLFFIGSQLVATGSKLDGVSGRVGVWNAVSQHWQAQDVVQITSHDTAGAFLLLGGVNGAIYYIDMQKFPLRLKDNDLLITDLYRDPSSQAITALSVYLTSKNTITAGNWIEVAYGTASGAVCVIVQHPELVGQGFQLFQTFTVHRSPVIKVMLSEKHLVSVCSDNNHVRTWTVTRFRGMISTQPGSMPHSSFKVLALEPPQAPASYAIGNNIGPYGEREEIQVFVQKVLPHCDLLYIRLSSTGRRVATVRSVDGSSISSFCLHECEGSSRMGSRPRRYLFTGHSNGAIQIWDMTTALDLSNLSKDDKEVKHGPTQQELLDLLGQCDLSVSSRSATPCGTNALSPVSDILEHMLLRNSNSSLASSGSVLCFPNQCERNTDVPSTSRSSGPTSLTRQQASGVGEAKLHQSSKGIDPKKRHSQVLESDANHSSRHHRNLSVSALASHLPSAGSQFSPSGGVPLPGLVPGRVESAERKEAVRSASLGDDKSSQQFRSAFRERKAWTQEIPRSASGIGASPGPASPRSPTEDVLPSRRLLSEGANGDAVGATKTHEAGCSRARSFSFKNRNNSNSEEQAAKLEAPLLPRGGYSRNSYKSAINDSPYTSPTPHRKQETTEGNATDNR